MAWRDEHVVASHLKHSYTLEDLLPKDITDEENDVIGRTEWNNPMAMKKKVLEAKEVKCVDITAPKNLSLPPGDTWCPEEVRATCDGITSYLEKAKPDEVCLWINDVYGNMPGVYNRLISAAGAQVKYRKLCVQIVGITPFHLTNLLRACKVGYNAKEIVEVKIGGKLSKDEARKLNEVAMAWRKEGVRLFNSGWHLNGPIVKKINNSD
jgi:hypothetical protein